LKAAISLLGFEDLGSGVEIGSIGVRSETGSRGAGKDNFKQAEKFLVNNPQFITQKTVLLFDHDVGKPDKDHSGILFVRSLPFNATNSKFRDGIENLLPLGILKTASIPFEK